MTLLDHLAYEAAWLAFGGFHSLTAGASARTGLGRWFGRAHRLAYNAIAIGQLAGVLALGHWLADGGGEVWHVPPLVQAVQYIMLGIGLVLGLAALKSYRSGPFIGWSQLAGEEDSTQPLVIDGLHKRVRHPLYSALLLLLWGAARSELTFATAVWASLYLLVGSMFEERRLEQRYGETYRAYRRRTPRFLPRIV